jgi:hypothetical protein
MAARIPGAQLPQGAAADIHIHVTAPVNITPFVARQKVNVFLLMEISTQMCSEPPDLLVGELLCWSVPVVLTSPARGVVGKVGEMLVDATTGELLVDETLIQRMREDADRLAERSPL